MEKIRNVGSREREERKGDGREGDESPKEASL